MLAQVITLFGERTGGWILSVARTACRRCADSVAITLSRCFHLNPSFFEAVRSLGACVGGMLIYNYNSSGNHQVARFFCRSMVKGPRGPRSAVPETHDQRLDKQMERQFVWRLTQTQEQKEMDRPRNTARKAAARSRLTPEQKAAISAKEVLRRATALAAMTPECKAAARVRRNRAGDAKRHARRGDLDTYCSCIGCTVCGGPKGKLCIEERVILLEMSSACCKAIADMSLGCVLGRSGCTQPNSPAWISSIDAAIHEAKQAQEKIFTENPCAYLAHINTFTVKPICMVGSVYGNYLEARAARKPL